MAVTVTGTNSATPTVTDVGDGTYTASYTPPAPGTDNVAITMGGTAISGSPYTSVVSWGGGSNAIHGDGAGRDSGCGDQYRGASQGCGR